MCDLIQFDFLLYAWGKSSLGDFIAAKSDRGLVAFEFASPEGNAVKDLQERFPNVVITEHPVAMAETIAALAHLVEADLLCSLLRVGHEDLERLEEVRGRVGLEADGHLRRSVGL